MSTRIVICVDLPSNNLLTAYKELWMAMAKIDPELDGWESSDEWYDWNGERVNEEYLAGVRMQVIGELREEIPNSGKRIDEAIAVVQQCLDKLRHCKGES